MPPPHHVHVNLTFLTTQSSRSGVKHGLASDRSHRESSGEDYSQVLAEPESLLMSSVLM